MRKTILAVIVLAGLCPAWPRPAAAFSHLWSQHFGSADSQGGADVAIDASGNIYAVGGFYNTIDFGTGVLTSLGFDDVFLAKFNSAGVCQWAKRFGDAAQVQAAEGVAVDPSGNVYMAGVFAGSINFGGGTLTSAGDRDIFVAKFNSAGTYVWGNRFGDALEQECMGIATDGSGNVFVYGYFFGSINFGGGPLTTAGSYDGYLAKFDTNGAYLWSHRYGDASDQRVMAAAADPAGNIYLTGGMTGTVDFGGGGLTTAGNFDVYLAKLDPAGSHVASVIYGDGANQQGSALAIDAAGNVYMTGYNSGVVNFGGGNLTSAGLADIYLVKFNASGVHQWSGDWGDTDNQFGNTLAVGPAGEVFLAGIFNGGVNFGGGLLTSAGIDDAYLAVFNTSGVHQWSQRFGDSFKYQATDGVAALPTNGCVITGHFQNTIDFGGGLLTSYGYIDMFLAEFGTLPTGVRTVPVDGLSISAFPNPFNPLTTIRYTVPSKGRVVVSVYDARGALIAPLVDAEKTAGSYSQEWNGHDQAGRAVASGVYFVRISHASGSRSEKLVLLK